MLPNIPRFALVADGENQDRALGLLDAIERHVSRSAPRDHQLAQIQFDRAPYIRMAPENRDRLLDESDGFNRCFGIVLGKEVGQALQVRQHPSGIDQLRQVLAFGRPDLLPAIR